MGPESGSEGQKKILSQSHIATCDKSLPVTLGIRLGTLHILLASCRCDKSLLPVSKEVEDGTRGNLHTLSVGKYQILGKPVLNKRLLDKLCRMREREHHPECSVEEHIFENDCQWKPEEHFRKSSLGCKEI